MYIGKAGNLRNRLKQYLNRKIRSPFIEHLLNEAEKLETRTTNSEIEALILESRLIKEKQPKYNIMLRDDKQYFYVAFTQEKFPKIFLTHQILNEKYIGPFTDGSALKTTLRLLRRIFPYCTCKQLHNNFCLNYHIGKCLGFCCLKNNPELVERTAEQKTKYQKNIKTIKDTLSDKKESLIKKLNKELDQLSKNQEFEKAIELRNKIEKLKRVFENARIINDATYQSDSKITTSLKTLKNIFKLQKLPKRIEGYDISNIQGKNATGSMVVFTHSTSSGQAGYRPDKNEYRKFKIIFKKTPDDIAMLKEILIRRFNHPDWSYPDLIFIDGGRAQLNVAIQTTKSKFPIISLAKGKNEVFSSTLKEPLPIKKLPTEIKNLILQIDSEAHRFAINYYRKLHRKTALPKPAF